MSNPEDIRREDVPPVSATRNAPRIESSGSDVRRSRWSEWEADYFLRLASDLWSNMTPRQRRKLARADVGVYAVVRAIAETRKGLLGVRHVVSALGLFFIGMGLFTEDALSYTATVLGAVLMTCATVLESERRIIRAIRERNGSTSER